MKLFGKKSDLWKKETELLQLEGTYRGVVRVVQPFAEWPFPTIYDCQSNQRKIFLFILVSLFFSLRDYVGNARNAGMLLRLSLPSNKRIPNTLFSFSSVTVDSF